VRAVSRTKAGPVDKRGPVGSHSGGKEGVSSRHNGRVKTKEEMKGGGKGNLGGRVYKTVKVNKPI